MRPVTGRICTVLATARMRGTLAKYSFLADRNLIPRPDPEQSLPEQHLRVSQGKLDKITFHNGLLLGSVVPSGTRFTQ